MTTQSSVGILASELTQVVNGVYDAMLKLETCESRTPWFPGEDRVTATVHLTGDWNGAVLLECNRWQACRFAGHFLSTDPPEAVDDVVRDVLGELVNMIGGNLKCVLTRGIRLSMPSVVDGSHYKVWVCGAEHEERLTFQCAQGLFWITVMTTRAGRDVPRP